MINKLGYKLLHIEGQDDARNQLVKHLHGQLDKYDRLESPTVLINSEESAHEFLRENPDFNLDPHGYNLDNIQGWKYGEIGVWASNYLGWKEFAESDLDYAMFMEDDLVITDNFEKVLSKYLDQLPESWEVFSFYVPGCEYHKFTDAHALGGKDVCYSYQDWSCACYLINKRSVGRLLESVKSPVTLPIDWHFFRQTHVFEVYSVRPDSEFACHLLEGESTFQNTQERKVLNGIL